MIDDRQQYFDPSYYNEGYYANMAQGNYKYFVETKGRSLLQNRINDILKVKILPGMHVLDIGCGRGELVMYTAFKGAIAYGIDYSGESISQAHKCLEFYPPEVHNNIHLYKSSIENMPFSGDIKFDRIMSWASIEHFHQWQWIRCLKNIYKLLKDDGVIVVATHPSAWYQNIGYPMIRPIKQLLLKKRLPTAKELHLNDLKTGHVNLKSPIQLKNDFTECNFKVKIILEKRTDYEINQTVAKAVGMVLENIPSFNRIFRQNIIAIAAKSEKVLNDFNKLNNADLIGN